MVKELRENGIVDMKNYGCNESTGLMVLKRMEEILSQNIDRALPNDLDRASFYFGGYSAN